MGRAKDSGYYKRELRERRIELEILKQIGETISYNWNLGEVLNSIIKIVSNYLKSDSCFIYLVEDHALVLQASQNPHRSALGKVKMKTGEGITGWVAKHRQTAAISSRAYEDERFKFFNALPEDRYEAFLSVPILWQGKVVGVINVQNVKPTVYPKNKNEFLEIIARQVGGAIENARLLSETNLLKQALETRKLVDKAKAVLMKNRNLTESEAHRLINRMSMDKRKTLKEIAESVLLSEELFE